MKNTYDKPLSQDLISAVKAIVEQPLDELSKNTLGRYAQVSVADRESKMKQAKNFIDAGKERRAKGDTETSDEYFDKASALTTKAARRKDGFNKAINKLTKEETEINEVSRALLGRYIRKGQKDVFKKQDDAFEDELNKRGVHWTSHKDPKHGHVEKKVNSMDDYNAASDASKSHPLQKKADKRQASLGKAADKVRKMKADDDAYLAKRERERKTGIKEETEINELSKATLGRYIKASAGDLISKQRVQDRQYNTARDYPRDSTAAKYHADAGMKTGKKIQNRRDGIDKATDKITAEPKKKEKPTLHGVFVKWHSGPYKGTEVAHGAWTKNKEKAQALADKLNKDSAGSHYSYHTKSTSR